MPILLESSVSLKALTHKLPIKFLVNMPAGCARGSVLVVIWSGDSSDP